MSSKKPRQLSLTTSETPTDRRFGGAFRNYKKRILETRGRKQLKRIALGNARSARPITCKQPMHLVMKSKRATGEKSFLHPKHHLKIQLILNKQGKKFGVKIKEYANSGNHLHLVILPRTRTAYVNFIRSTTGLIARQVLKKQRGCGFGTAKATSTAKATNSEAARGATTAERGKSNSFWESIPFTRILSWGRELKALTKYLEQNSLEAFGFSTIRKPLKFSYG